MYRVHVFRVEATDLRFLYIRPFPLQQASLLLNCRAFSLGGLATFLVMCTLEGLIHESLFSVGERRIDALVDFGLGKAAS